MNKTSIKIMKRVNDALIHFGYKRESQRAIYLTAKMGVTYKTALGWVRLKSFPRKWMKLLELLKDRDINPGWLFAENNQPMLWSEAIGISNKALQFAEDVSKLPEQEQQTIEKMINLLGNNKTKDETMDILIRCNVGQIPRPFAFNEIEKLWKRRDWVCLQR